MQQQPIYDSARALFHYNEPMRQLVHRYKYGGETRLAAPLGRLLFAGLRQLFDPTLLDWVLPVPLHAARQRQRGFNQALLLTSNWSRLFSGHGGGNTDCPRIADRVLIRCKHTRSQTGLDRKQRQSNLHGAMQVADPAAVKGKGVLLVDDVMTTGATAQACALALSKAGARQVHVLTLARAV